MHLLKAIQVSSSLHLCNDAFIIFEPSLENKIGLLHTVYRFTMFKLFFFSLLIVTRHNHIAFIIHPGFRDCGFHSAVKKIKKRKKKENTKHWLVPLTTAFSTLSH